MKYLLILFVMLSTTAVAKVEIWECYYDGIVVGVLKLDTDEPSIAYRKDAKWSYWEHKIIHDKENQNLSTETRVPNVFDLLLKKYFRWGIEYDCKVIDP